MLIAGAALALAAAGVLLLRRRGARQALPAAPPEVLAGISSVLLGGEPCPDDLVGEGATAQQAAERLAASEQHRRALADGRAGGVLVGTPAAERVHPPGTLSPDGVAIVGNGGRIYIAHGANEFSRQYRGEVTLSAEGVAGWGRLLDRCRAEASQRAIRLACLVAPDNLAVAPECFPEPLPTAALRPVQQILEANPGAVSYPLAALRRAAGQEQTSLRTDSHLSSRGSEIVLADVLAQLGVGRRDRRRRRPRAAHLAAGDLGRKFDPPIHEVVLAVQPEPGVEIVEDNAQSILDLGGHLGVRRVTRCESAPVDGRLAIFGDSYTFVQPTAAGTLGELLARTFREVHFLWAPFCWDSGYVERNAPDFVLLQMAERFAVTVPREGADVEALAAETLRRKGGIVPEEITDPAVAAPTASQ